MDIDACFQLGHVTKLHGLNGGVSIHLDVDYPKDYEKLESVFVELNNRLVPFFVESLRITKDKATVKFEDIDSIEQAQRLIKCRIFLPLAQLPNLESDQFYFHEIIGFRVVDKNLGELGLVKTVYDSPNQDLISMDYKDREVLIPIIDEIVLGVDRKESIIHTSLPNGLLDIYMED